MFETSTPTKPIELTKKYSESYCMFLICMWVSITFAVVFTLTRGAYTFKGLDVAGEVYEQVTKCEAVLPRNQHCTYKIVAQPTEGE